MKRSYTIGALGEFERLELAESLGERIRRRSRSHAETPRSAFNSTTYGFELLLDVTRRCWYFPPLSSLPYTGFTQIAAHFRRYLAVFFGTRFQVFWR
jgi:hypothetical protein